jgi:hypothetical protein
MKMTAAAIAHLLSWIALDFSAKQQSARIEGNNVERDRSYYRAWRPLWKAQPARATRLAAGVMGQSVRQPHG